MKDFPFDFGVNLTMRDIDSIRFVKWLLPSAPDDRFVNEEAYRQMETMLEEKGAINEVDASYFESFAELTGAQLHTIARVLLKTHHRQFNLLAYANRESDFLDYLDVLLFLVARGMISFSDTGTVFSKPEGPEPTPDVIERWAERIEKAHEMLPDILLEACQDVH
jgi:hypothetical protein